MKRMKEHLAAPRTARSYADGNRLRLCVPSLAAGSTDRPPTNGTTTSHSTPTRKDHHS